MSAKAFVDTNVLMRAITPTMPLHHEARALIRQVRLQRYELWINRQVIREYLVQVTRPQAFMQPVPMTQIEYRVAMLYRLFLVADETAAVTAELLKLMKRIPMGGKQVHDANIVATMLAYKIDTLLTTNVADMKRFEPGIQVMPLVATP